MKIRTVEELSDNLFREIAWRRKELVALRSLIRLRRHSSDERKALIRSGITVLYAHWEGFVKAAASGYLNFVSMQRHRYEELTPNFVALAMKSKLQLASETNQARVFNEVAVFFLSRLSERCTLPEKSMVKARSNLSSAVFRDIMHRLNLDYQPYRTKEKLIDERMLKHRNNVAHGEYLDVGLDEYLDLHDEVMQLLDWFRNDIDKAASTRAYLSGLASPL